MLDTASAEFRASAVSLLAEGVAYDQQKKWTKAIEAYQKCVKRDKNNSKAWFALGYAYYNQNGKEDCEEAIEPYEQCIKLDRSNMAAHVNLGTLYKNVRGDHDSAEAMYRKAIKLDKTNAKAHSYLGNVLTLNGDYAGAEVKHRKAVELDPSNMTVRNNLADFLVKRGDLGEAEKEISEAIEINRRSNPQVALPHGTYAEILEKKNDIPGAIEAAEEFVRLGGIRGNDGKEYLARLRENLKTSTQ